MQFVESSLDDHYTGGLSAEYKDVLSEVDENENIDSAKVNLYASNLMKDICDRVYREHKEETLEKIKKSIESIIDEIFSIEEMEEIYKFVATQTGKKLFRNIDLIKSCVDEGRKIMSISIITEWSKPDVTKKISDYIKYIEEEEEEKDEENE